MYSAASFTSGGKLVWTVCTIRGPFFFLRLSPLDLLIVHVGQVGCTKGQKGHTCSLLQRRKIEVGPPPPLLILVITLPRELSPVSPKTAPIPTPSPKQSFSYGVSFPPSLDCGFRKSTVAHGDSTWAPNPFIL